MRACIHGRIAPCLSYYVESFSLWKHIIGTQTFVTPKSLVRWLPSLLSQSDSQSVIPTSLHTSLLNICWIPRISLLFHTYIYLPVYGLLAIVKKLFYSSPYVSTSAKCKKYPVYSPINQPPEVDTKIEKQQVKQNNPPSSTLCWHHSYTTVQPHNHTYKPNKPKKGKKPLAKNQPRLRSIPYLVTVLPVVTYITYISFPTKGQERQGKGGEKKPARSWMPTPQHSPAPHAHPARAIDHRAC